MKLIESVFALLNDSSITRLQQLIEHFESLWTIVALSQVIARAPIDIRHLRHCPVKPTRLQDLFRKKVVPRLQNVVQHAHSFLVERIDVGSLHDQEVKDEDAFVGEG